MLSPLAGNGTEGTFVPFELFAGESDVITTNETVAVGFSVAQYVVMGKRADGFIVPVAPNTSDEAGALFAAGTLTFGGQPTAADTLTVNGVAITFETSGAVGHQVNIGVSATATAQAVKAFLNANVPTFGVNADGIGTVLTLTAETAGAAGNSIGLAKSGTYPAVSAATMTGGADTGAEPAKESRAFCIMAQAVDATSVATSAPVFTGGVFNHASLIWPPSLSTETTRRQAFDRSPISVKSLK